MTMAEVAKGFGVGESTASAKAKVIFQSIKTHQLDPRWSLTSLLDLNPLVWMFEVNGILVDIRNMPRELQAAVFEQGLIPYIPADRK
jgi:hypothetical protein